jgi:hypothetical protein
LKIETGGSDCGSIANVSRRYSSACLLKRAAAIKTKARNMVELMIPHNETPSKNRQRKKDAGFARARARPPDMPIHGN